MEHPEKANQPPEQVSVRVDWSNAADVPTSHVNQIVSQVGPPTMDGAPDGIYLLLGNLAPPVIVDTTPEGRQRAIEDLKNGLEVTVHGRFHMSRERLAELIKILETTAAQYDAALAKQRRGQATSSEEK